MQFIRISVVSIAVFIAGIYLINRSSKGKSEYTKNEGNIVYFAKEYENLPNRHHGDYRYLQIDTYPYVFEIYEPNSIPAHNHIDELKIGDKIEIYYYETSNTHDEGINRFTQFIDKENISYFIRDGFQKTMGYVVMGIGVLLGIGGLVIKKKGLLKS